MFVVRWRNERGKNEISLFEADEWGSRLIRGTDREERRDAKEGEARFEALASEENTDGLPPIYAEHYRCLRHLCLLAVAPVGLVRSPSGGPPVMNQLQQHLAIGL